MSHSGKCWLIILTLMAGAATAEAQPSSGKVDKQQMQARYQIFVMEGVIERAVQHGAQLISRQMQAIMPDMVLLAGAARARGFRLDGYGVFFDVEVPALRRSMAWSFRMLDQNDLALNTALQALRRHVQSLSDQRARTDLEQALTRVELQVGPVGAPGDPASPSPPGQGAPAQPTATTAASMVPADDPTTARSRLLSDPGSAYTSEVKDALIDAMLDYSGSISVGPDEWLTIAARDNEDRRLTPEDPYEVSTIVLRVRGTDLAAFRTGRITRDEAREHVEVREF